MQAATEDTDQLNSPPRTPTTPASSTASTHPTPANPQPADSSPVVPRSNPLASPSDDGWFVLSPLPQPSTASVPSRRKQPDTPADEESTSPLASSSTHKLRSVKRRRQTMAPQDERANTQVDEQPSSPIASSSTQKLRSIVRRRQTMASQDAGSSSTSVFANDERASPVTSSSSHKLRSVERLRQPRAPQNGSPNTLVEDGTCPLVASSSTQQPRSIERRGQTIAPQAVPASSRSKLAGMSSRPAGFQHASCTASTCEHETCGHFCSQNLTARKGPCCRRVYPTDRFINGNQPKHAHIRFVMSKLPCIEAEALHQSFENQHQFGKPEDHFWRLHGGADFRDAVARFCPARVQPTDVVDLTMDDV
jgi:hypothetical protein